MGLPSTNLVAMTCSVVREPTKALFDAIGDLGYTPIVITRESNREDIGNRLGLQALNSAIFCSDLNDPLSTSTEVEKALREKGMHLLSLINVVDLLTPSMLMTCDRIGLSFPFLESYKRCRTKSHTRTTLQSAHLSTLQFELIDLFDDSATPSLTFPFVAKPIMGAGSAFVYRVDNARQWSEYRDCLRTEMKGTDERIGGIQPLRQIMLEELANGQMFQIDGFCFDGKLHVCGLGLKFHEVSHGHFKQGFKEVGGIQYRPFSIPDYVIMDEKLVDLAESVCRALDFRCGTFHLEGMFCSSSIEMIEMNPRPGGSAVVPIVDAISGVNLSRQLPRLWMEKVPTQFPRTTETHSVLYAILYPPKSTTIRAIQPAATIQLPFSDVTEARWIPEHTLKVGSRVGDASGEEYLGEVHISDYTPLSADALRRDVDRLALSAGHLIEFD